MKRNNGFLDLTVLKPSSFKKSEYSENHFWVEINDKWHFFKTSNFPYLELICYKIAKRLDIKAIKYDLAVFADKKGVISPDYRKAGYRYLPGYEVLNNLYNADPDFVGQMGLEEGWEEIYESPSYLLMNNLEVIWAAIEYGYPHISKEQKIKCIYDLVCQYIFSIFTMQYDKGAQNWELEVSDSELKVVPLFDNEGAFTIENYSVSMATSFADIEKPFDESLKKFLAFSSSEYLDLFIEKFEMLKNIDMVDILSSIENEIGCQIPEEEKNNYIRAFNNNVNKIAVILEERKENKIGR